MHLLELAGGEQSLDACRYLGGIRGESRARRDEEDAQE
jgi:hypothetical protein